MKSSEKQKEKGSGCSCPYCEEELALDSPWFASYARSSCGTV